MRSTVKWGGGLLVLTAMLTLVAGLVLWRTVTPASGTAFVAGLSNRVTIVRDEHAIAHVEAESFVDAARALGFVHAQERLWQMEVLRRTARGRLAELFGKQAVDFDLFLRALGMDRAASASLSALEPETLAVLNAYAAGVNAWAGRERGLLEAAFPPEFLAFGVTFEPWKPADSAAVMKLMSLQLSKNLSEELRRLKLAARGLNSSEIADLMPSHPDDRPPPMPDLRELLPLRDIRDVVSADDETAALNFLAAPVSRWASNAWVVSGERTESGKPLLANDPHLSMSAPSLWYLAHLRWKTGGTVRNLTGASLPGLPVILLGRNDDVAWGFTNAGADVQDIVVERVRAGSEDEYLTPDGWRSFETRTERIDVRGAASVTFERRSTRNGPVLPDTLPLPADAPTKFSNLLKELHVPSLRWTGLAEDDTTLDALVAMANASTTGELVAATSDVVSPMQAIVVADRDGSIALVTPARVPVRSAENLIAGRAPVPGWSAEYDWKGQVDASSVPTVIDPVSGSIVTANSRLPNADKLHMTYDWDETARSDRAMALVTGADREHDLASMVAVQNDVRSEPLLALRDSLLALYQPADSTDLLRAWDGEMQRDAVAPTMMVAWARFLLQRALADDLGSAFKAVDDINHHAITRILSGGARDWCDDRGTPRFETCVETVEAAWSDALADLTERYGADRSSWTWGRAHVVLHAHQPFDKVPVLRQLFSIERAAGGGPHTLNRGKTDVGKDEPYAVVHGAGYKAVYDLSDNGRSVFVQSTGQSGNPFSRYYRSFATEWAEGRYVSIKTIPVEYRKRMIGVWRLHKAD